MVIDLRSDTITLPSPELRAVIAAAAVGDDVYGEDPSVNLLEQRAAARMGKEAALFVPTGTMGNLCAHLAHTTPGQELVCGSLCHTFAAEAGGAARIAGLSIRTFPQTTAELDPVLIDAAIRPLDIHYPPTGLIWIEQPSRGYVMPLANLARLSELARRHGVPIHMDGARIFNAAAALGVSASVLAAYVDSVMFCVSKGLAAPVGSLLAGEAPFIERARSARKILGGSMRQAGIIAAAGLHALEHSPDRLYEDHEHARRLADGMRGVPGLRVDRAEVQTNIFFVELTSAAFTAAEFVSALADHDIRVNKPSGTSKVVRFVTNADVSSSDVDRALEVIRAVMTHAERREDAAVVSEAHVA